MIDVRRIEESPSGDLPIATCLSCRGSKGQPVATFAIGEIDGITIALCLTCLRDIGQAAGFMAKSIADTMVIRDGAGNPVQLNFTKASSRRKRKK